MLKYEKIEKFNKETGKDFNSVASNIFAPIYPVIAEQIIKRCGKKSGICIDLGSGPGHLAIALAKISDFKIYGLDYSEDINDIARENIESENLSGRIEPVLGSVEDIPFMDNSADIFISRGSMFFWPDIEKAFMEIVRVLKPGGKTYIGGGFGSAELRTQITAEMRKRDPEWECRSKSRLGQENSGKISIMLEKLQIAEKTIINDESGMWILISK